MAQPRGHLTCDLPVIGIGSVPGWLLCDLHPIGTSTSSPDPQDAALPARRGPYLLPCLFVIAVLLASPGASMYLIQEFKRNSAGSGS